MTDLQTSLFNTLSEILPSIGIIGPSNIRVTGTEDETIFEASTATGMQVFVSAILKEPAKEFIGRCGLNNLKLIQGLLDFNSYKDHEASLEILRNADGENPYKIVFTDAYGEKSEVILMDSSVSHATKLPRLKASTPIDLSFVPDKDRISEFGKLYRLYADTHQYCVLYSRDNKLIAKLGADIGSNTGSYVIAENVEGEYTDTSKQWHVASILDILRINAHRNVTMNLNAKANFMSILVDTPVANYTYCVRPDSF